MVCFKPYVGTPVYINPNAIVSVRQVTRRDNDGLDYKHTQVQVSTAIVYEFRDTVEEVVKAVEQAKEKHG